MKCFNVLMKSIDLFLFSINCGYILKFSQNVSAESMFGTRNETGPGPNIRSTFSRVNGNMNGEVATQV